MDPKEMSTSILSNPSILSTHMIEAIVIIALTIIGLILFGSKERPIRKEEHDELTAEVIYDEISCNKRIDALLSSKIFYIGLDCEWTPSLPQFNSKQYKIGLIQIATDSDILLIRLNKMKYAIPKSLKSLLTNDQIIKCGVGIHQDVTKIFRDFGVKTRGVLELNDLFKISSFYTQSPQTIKNTEKRTFGLKHLCKTVCGKVMKYKSKQITLSHWNSFEYLTLAQINYAADDALVGSKIFSTLMDDIFGLIDKSEYRVECNAYIDLYEIKSKKERTQNDIESVKKQKLKLKMKQQRKSKMECEPNKRYKILKPDGSILFFCGKFRFEWFKFNKLATEIDERSCKLIISGFVESEECKSMDNVCFVCGVQGSEDGKIEIDRFKMMDDYYWHCLNDEELQQKVLTANMIPLCFQKPIGCVAKAKKCKMKFIESLCEKYPQITQHPCCYKFDGGYRKAKSAANALYKCHETIPIKRKIELVKNVADYFDLIYDDEDIDNIDDDENESYDEILNVRGCRKEIDGITDEMNSKQIFGFCMNVMTKSEKEVTIEHAEELLEHFEGSEEEFVLLWREMFMDVMKPKFVPNYWPMESV